LGRVAAQRLGRVHARGQVLVLLEPLRHAVKRIGRHLTHLLEVGFLLSALIGPRNGVKRALLLGEGRDGRLHGRRGRRGETASHRCVLSSTAFRTEHAVGRNLFAARPAIHLRPSLKDWSDPS